MSAANHNTKLSSIDADYVKELKALKDFANDKLKRNSTISIAVQQLITQLEINVANTAKADEFSVTIIDSENAQNNLSFNGNFSLKILKEQLETNRKKVRRLYNKRLGKAWTDLDDRSLVELGFINGDQVYVDFSTVDNSQTSEVNGLQRLVFHNYYPTESAEAVALAVHCCVLDKGFVPLYEQTNQVPGFAAPMKELPKDKLVPPNWKKADSIIYYKHPSSASKVYSLKMSSENACVKATFGLKNGQGMVSDFPIERFVATESVIDDYVAPTSEDNFQRMFKDNLQLIFTNFEDLADEVNKSTKNVLPNPEATVVRPANNTSLLILASPSELRSTLPRIGEYDFPQDRVPFDRRYIDSERGGNMIGPNHPIFQPPLSDEGLWNPLPEARFDPIGPVLGPNGPDLGIPGVDSRGRVIPRKPQLFPGEPTPDHFRPPTW